MHSIRLRQSHWDQIQAHLERCLPFEGCGLLAGRAGLVTEAHPVSNVVSSATRFRMDPREQVRALFGVEERDLELLAIYHSHPHGPTEPSETDRHEAAYPDAAHLICARSAGGWSARAFLIDKDGAVIEIPIDWNG